MANSVENQVVRMEFDNKTFQQRIKDTVSALADLKTRLNFKGGSGIDDLQKKSDKFSLGGMTSQTEKVSAGFLAMATVGITALANITNRAVDAGITIAKSLSLDPIMDGFAEYELNMNSIQTILANTRRDGTTLEDVNGALDELNRYSDQTIYNFAQMTRNIGAATAAGVDLDTATTMVKGFANSAAIAGVDATSMAGALEQMTQSLAAGVVKAQDWISLERRGLAGQVQQRAFFDMAKAMGTLADVPVDQSFDEWTDAGNTLRGSLQNGWLTADVFNQTMKAFSGEMTRAELAALGMGETAIEEMLELGEVGVDAATKVRTLTQLFDTTQEAIASGWSETFRTVIGDFEEASELFTDLSNGIGNLVGNSSDARNQVLSEWAALGGRDVLLQGLKDAVQGFATIIAPIRDAFRQIFPRKTGEDLFKLTKRFAAFTKSIAIGEGTADNLRRIFAGLFAVLKIGVIIVKAVASTLAGMFSVVAGGSGGAFLSFFASIGDRFVQLYETLRDGRINELVDRIVESFANFVGKIDLTPIANTIRNVWAAVKGFVETIDLSPIVEAFKAVADAAKNLISSASGIGSFFQNLFGSTDSVGGEDVASSFEKGESAAKSFNDVLNIVDSTLKRGQERVDSAKDSVEAFSKKFGEAKASITSALQPLFDVFSNIKNAVGDAFGAFNPALLLAGGGLAGFGGFVVVLNKIANAFKKISKDGLDLTGGFMPQLAGIAGDVRRVLGGVNDTLGAMQTNLKATAILKIAAAIGILALSIGLLALIDGDKIAVSLSAITVVIVQLAAALEILTRLMEDTKTAGKLVAVAISLAILAGALLLFALAVKVFSTMELDELAVGLAGVAGSLGVFIAAIKLGFGKDTEGIIKSAVTIGILAISLSLLAGAIKLMALIGWQDLIVGLVAVGASLGIMVLALNNLNTDGVLKAGVSIGVIAASLYILVGAIRLISLMDPVEIATGLATIAIGLTGLVLALNRINENSVLAKAGAIALIGVALNLMARAVSAMAKNNWEEIGRGLAGLAGSMILLYAILSKLDNPEVVKGGFALILIANGLKTLAEVITIMGQTPIGILLRGLGALAAMMITLGVTSLLMKPFILALGTLSVGLLAAGAGVFLVGAGMYYMAKAIRVLAKAGTSGLDDLMIVIDAFLKKLPEIAAALGVAAVSFARSWLEGMDELLPLVLELLGKLLVGIGEMAPQFFETAVVVLTEFLKGVQEVIPDVVDTLVTIISEFLGGLVELYPDIIQAGIDLLLELIKGITENISDIASAATDLIVEFLGALGDSYSDIASAGAEMIGELLAAIADAAVDIVSAGADAVLKFLEGVASKAVEVVDAGFTIIIDFINGLADTIEARTPELMGAGVNLMTSFLRGMTAFFWTAIKGFFQGVPSDILGYIGNLLWTLFNKGMDLLKGFWNGIEQIWNTVVDFFKGIGGWILDQFVNVGWWLYNAGRDLVGGFIKGVTDRLWSWSPAGLFYNNVVKPVKGVLESNSPSKVFMRIGEDTAVGYILGVEGMMGAVEKTSMDMADKSLRGAKEGLNSGIRQMSQGLETLDLDASNPVITPVLDMSTAEKQLTDFQKSSIGIGTTIDSVTATALLRLPGAPSEEKSSSNIVEITQINNSPKALSTSDIYRQTKGLVAVTKEELGIR